jgi:MraZ protein
VYYGEAQTVLDDKGRITLPVRFRQTMDVLKHSDWYMARGFDHSIFLFPHQEWTKIREQVSKFASMDPRALDFRRMLFGSVAEVAPDRQGRMPVPQNLRDHAGLQKDVVVIGVEDHLEIWSKERWQAYQAGQEDAFKDMAGHLLGANNGSAQPANAEGN